MELELENDRQTMEQERVKMYIQYLSQIFSQPLREKPSFKYLQAKKEFEQLIKPSNNTTTKQKGKVYKWDFERKQESRKEVTNNGDN